MKKNIVAVVVMLCASISALGMSAPAKAEMGKNAIGPSLLLGNGNTTIGVDSKFGVNENLSLRPFVYFPSGATLFGSSLTYDFNIVSSSAKITPFLGGGITFASANNGGNSNTTVFLTGGADFAVTDSVELKAALDVPLSSNNSSTNVRLGAGFQF